MTVSSFFMIRAASRARAPWDSQEAGRVDQRTVRNIDQVEIDSCLNCPFASCEGTARKCRYYKSQYRAKVEGRA